MNKKITLVMAALLAVASSLSAQPGQNGQQHGPGMQGPPPGGQPQRRPRITAGMEFSIEDLSVHDPVMAKENGTYYVFCTGQGISISSSKDLKNWKIENPVFSEPPAWTMEDLPGFRGHMWAPDIIYHDGQWHIFYACSAFGRNTSLIGHATNPTLDPESPDYKWTDQGKILQSVPNRDMWNAIDPNVVVDENGTPWLDFGSFWDGIKMVKLSNDMMHVAQPEVWYSISRRERKFDIPDSNAGNAALEAPFIYKHGDWYYLFVSFDYCCRGVNSTYKVVVGRSEKAEGPYLDKDGKDMFMGGGSLVIEGNKDWNGIGHNSAYTFDGKDYYISHAYDANDNGQSKLIIREIVWTSDGWPTVSW